ncbi:MAG: hypothetical protein ACFCBW_06635, partial [Candidatus Competibacterales bacterium]
MVRPAFGFVAGFVATLVFHQLTLWALYTLGVAPFAPFNMNPTAPLGVPAVFSLAFWGGIWGMLFALIDRPLFGGGLQYWINAFLFGAIFPSLAALLVGLPPQRIPMGGGWNPMLL